MSSPDACPVVKVMPWGENQGDFVEVDKSAYDADPTAYQLYDDKQASLDLKAKTKAENKTRLEDEAKASEAAVDDSKASEAGWNAPPA